MRRKPISIAAALLAAAAIAAVLAVLLSAPESHSSTELALQRSQLALVSRQLLRLERPVASEVLTARAAWPSIAKGLPAHPGTRLAQQVAAANAAAHAVPAPAFLGIRHELIGPAERVASLVENFESLTQQSWAQLSQALGALQHGSAATASFERSNAGLYINSIYDAHFEASLIGEHILNSYKRLGGPHAFGSSLTQAQVHSILTAFSPQAVRLTPHLWKELLAER